ncbi:MAG: murein biosynthesis integral membrane protein MurJ [Sphingomonadales bacterium 32-64-17]|nr:MAG: murein biosynthesis integral membrane protein MurJ [Sphingomonadales bacterium 32-64-17]
MSLLKNVGTIGSLTLVSRIAGMAREMIFSRVLGANEVTDAWFQAFIIPNVFRRLFAEGAFSAAFVPMFSKKLHADSEEGGGLDAARKFSNEVLSVFVPALLALTAIFEIVMPGVIWLLADKPIDAGQFAYSVDFARIMFPYILLVSLVTLLTGMLNSVSKFMPGASFPIILNIVLIAALLGADSLVDTGAPVEELGYIIACAVPVAGLLQLAWLVYWARKSKFRMRLTRPRLTPEVKRLAIIALPAAIGGGAYQINTLIQLYFLNQLEGSAVSWMNYADRLNQLPLGIIGIALSTAILPTLSRFIGAENREGAARVQSDAIEIGLLLTLPATVALGVCGVPFITMIFEGGRFAMADAAATGGVLSMLVLGLPAYVLVKVLVPNFYARSDTRTPVYAAVFSLVIFVAFNLAFLHRLGVEGVALASAIGAWVNLAYLYTVLVKRNYYRGSWTLLGRILRQLLAAVAMGTALFWAQDLLTSYYSAGLFARLFALAVLVACAAVVYFGVAFLVGAIDRARIAQLIGKRAES